MRPNHLIAIICLLLAVALAAIDQGYVDYLPVPTPEPPPTTLHAIIIEESGDRQDKPDLAIILASTEVRDLFGQFRPIDPDTPVHPDFQPYVKRAPQLPWLFLIDPDGKLWWEGEPPMTIQGWRELVQEIKG